MIFCKICNKQVKISNPIDIDTYLWRHMREKHPKEFKAQSDKEIEDLFRDNFRADNSETMDIFEKRFAD